jgi:hypothetical protein
MDSRRNRIPNEDRFQDLDALVLAEIESLSRAEHHRRPPRGPDHRAPAPAASVRPARRSERPAEEEFTGEAFDEQAALADSSEEDESQENSSVELLSPEEQAFISRAVGSLSNRGNADMILTCVWDQLTEADPEAFFRPAEEGSQPDSDAPTDEGDTAQPSGESPSEG